MFWRKKKKLINPLKPRRNEYVRIWSEERLMLKNSVPENMKNLSFENKLRMWFVNYFKFLNMKGFIFYMLIWIVLDILLFFFFQGWLMIFYYFALKYLIIVIFVKCYWIKTRYFNILKSECVKKKKSKKKKIFFVLIVIFMFILYFLNPLFFLTLFI